MKSTDINAKCANCLPGALSAGAIGFGDGSMKLKIVEEGMRRTNLGPTLQTNGRRARVANVVCGTNE